MDFVSVATRIGQWSSSLLTLSSKAVQASYREEENRNMALDWPTAVAYSYYDWVQKQTLATTNKSNIAIR